MNPLFKLHGFWILVSLEIRSCDGEKLDVHMETIKQCKNLFLALIDHLSFAETHHLYIIVYSCHVGRATVSSVSIA